MLRSVMKVVDQASWDWLAPVCVVSVVALAIVGILAGPALPMSAFFLVPLFALAVVGGPRAALFIAVEVSVARTVVLVAVSDDATLFTAVWMFGSCLLTYWLIGGLVAVLAERLREEELVGRLDPLTGLGNARWFYERAEHERAQLLGAPFVVAYLDVDNFKDVNDVRGHSGGDAALVDVATTMASALRTDDIVARLGGDEFLVLLPMTDATTGHELLAMLHTRLAVEVGERWGIGFSIGAVACDSWDASVDALVHLADQTMYKAKSRGRGTIVEVGQPAGAPPAEDVPLQRRVPGYDRRRAAAGARAADKAAASF